MKKTYPIMKKYLNSEFINIEEIRLVNKAIYSDRYQVVTESCKVISEWKDKMKEQYGVTEYKEQY